jgi:hypothetical protein
VVRNKEDEVSVTVIEVVVGGRVLTFVKVAVVGKTRVRYPSNVVQNGNPSLILRSDTTLLTDATEQEAKVSQVRGRQYQLVVYQAQAARWGWPKPRNLEAKQARIEAWSEAKTQREYEAKTEDVRTRENFNTRRGWIHWLNLQVFRWGAWARRSVVPMSASEFVNICEFCIAGHPRRFTIFF